MEGTHTDDCVWNSLTAAGDGCMNLVMGADRETEPASGRGHSPLLVLGLARQPLGLKVGDDGSLGKSGPCAQRKGSEQKKPP